MSTILLDTVYIDVFGSLSIALLDISLSIMMNLIKQVSTILLDTVSIDVFSSLSIALLDISLSQF